MNRSYILILSVILVSGCLGIDIGSIFGGDVLNIQQTIIRETPGDAVVVKDAQLIPTSPLLPDMPVTLTFTVENRDERKSAEKVYVDIFNAPSFKNENDDMCNRAGCFTKTCNKNNLCTIIPGEQKQITASMKALSVTEIAGLKTETTLDYSLNYDFASSLVYTVPVVNLDEIIKRQRTNEKTTIEFSKSHSSGPVMIDAELSNAKYILSGQPAFISFKIKNTGGGTVNNSEIAKFSASLPEPSGSPQIFGDVPNLPGINVLPVIQGLRITFPPELRAVSWPKNFYCSGSFCYNKEPIDMYRDETRTSMLFKVEPSLPPDVPLRSYTITATVGYTYELRNSMKVTLKPF